MKSMLYRIIRSVLLMSLILLTAVAWVITTEIGTRTMLRVGTAFFPDRLTIDTVQGRLLDSLNLQNVSYNSPSVQLKIKQINFNWHMSALFRGKLWIDSIRVNDGEIKINPRKNRPGQLAIDKEKLPLLPFAIQINQLQLSHITIRYTEQKPIVVEKLSTQLLLDKNIFATLTAQLLSPILISIDLNLKGTADHYQWHLALQGAQANWLANGQGGQKGIALQTAKSQLLGGELSASGQLNWLPTLNWQFSVRAKSLNLQGFNAKAPRALGFVAKTAGSSRAFDLNIENVQAVQQNMPLNGHLNLQANIQKMPEEVTSIDSLLTTMKNVNFQVNAFVQLGKSSVIFYGGLLDHWDLYYKLQVPAINQLVPTWNGSINLTGTIKGPYAHPLSNTNFYIQYLRSTDETKPAWIKDFNGKLSAELQIKQTLANSQLLGSIDLTSSKVGIPYLGLQLKDLNLHADMDKDSIQYRGNIFSGPGSVQLTGQSPLKESAVGTVISLNGKQFLVSNLPKLKLYLSPALRLENKDNAWHMKGEIEIPAAEIKFPHFTQTVTLPRETIIVKPSGEIAPTKIVNTFAEVNLLLGNSVHLQTSGLDSFIAGKLLIKDYPGKETLASGRLELTKGSYNLQGQKLSVNQSTIIFANSPITNPNLQLRATKAIPYTPSEQILPQSQNLMVGIEITGAAENPKIMLFSDPAGWSQADILSLIVLGKPVSAVSGANVQLLAAAANALTPQSSVGINQLTEQLQQLFGFSEFGLASGVSSKPGENKPSTSFVMGKYLSPRLYLSYSLGILETVNTLRLRYLLSKHWSIQTQANTLGSGVDVFYFIEH